MTLLPHPMHGKRQIRYVSMQFFGKKFVIIFQNENSIINLQRNDFSFAGAKKFLAGFTYTPVCSLAWQEME